MKKRCRPNKLFIVIVTMSVCGFVVHASPVGQGTVQVHLPREIAVKQNQVTLNDIAVLLGDEKLMSDLKPIMLGKITVASQQLVFEKETILARLVCSGIDADRLNFTGAQKVVVTRQAHKLAAGRIIEEAKAFLIKNPPAEDICYIQPVRQSGDLVLEDKIVRPIIKCSYLDGTSANYAKIKVQVFDGQIPVADSEVDFRLKFETKRSVATNTIEQGETITQVKVKTLTVIADHPPRQAWSNPVGMVAVRRLAKGAQIRPGTIRSEDFKVSIERNKSVVIRAEKYGFIVTSVGIALQKGNEGDTIRVRNIDSNRIVTMKINTDGSVSPIL